MYIFVKISNYSWQNYNVNSYVRTWFRIRYSQHVALLFYTIYLHFEQINRQQYEQQLKGRSVILTTMIYGHGTITRMMIAEWIGLSNEAHFTFSTNFLLHIFTCNRKFVLNVFFEIAVCVQWKLKTRVNIHVKSQKHGKSRHNHGIWQNSQYLRQLPKISTSVTSAISWFSIVPSYVQFYSVILMWLNVFGQTNDQPSWSTQPGHPDEARRNTYC